MNHNGVTLNCGRCERAAVVIIAGAHYCSGHALDATLNRVAGRRVIDLRTSDPAAPRVVAMAS